MRPSDGGTRGLVALGAADAEGNAEAVEGDARAEEAVGVTLEAVGESQPATIATVMTNAVSWVCMDLR